MKRLELIFWATLPCLITLALALFCLIPKHMAGLSYFMPALVVMPIFFWGLLGARDMPFWFVFALGLFMDAVQGAPLGLSSLCYTLFLLLVGAQGKYILKEGFVVKWGYFALLLGVMSIVYWVVLALVRSQMPPILPPLIQYGLTLCLYPIFHRLFDILFEQSRHRRRQIAHGR